MGSSWVAAHLGCHYVACEVKVPSFFLKNLETKKTDILGIQEKGLYNTGHSSFTIRNIEVKVSKNDFKNGFSMLGDYNYILAPAGLLGKEDMPSYVGLIEVDLKELEWKKDKIEGINIIKKSRKYEPYRVSRKNYINCLKNRMLKKHSNSQVYRNPWFQKEG